MQKRRARKVDKDKTSESACSGWKGRYEHKWANGISQCKQIKKNVLNPISHSDDCERVNVTSECW